MGPTLVPARNQAPTPRPPPPQLSATLFPTLPSSGSNNNQHKPSVSGNRSLQHILGEANTSSANAWGQKKDVLTTHPTASVTEADIDMLPVATGASKGKKKKGKEKQTLFTLGTFPT